MTPNDHRASRRRRNTVTITSVATIAAVTVGVFGISEYSSGPTVASAAAAPTSDSGVDGLVSDVLPDPDPTVDQVASPAFRNVVMILADDLDWKLFDQIPRLQALKERGMTFTNHTVVDSLCCPSRVTIMRGQYIHNHEVVSNIEATGGGWPTFQRLDADEDCLPVWLNDAGVTTALYGKYLNEYPTRPDGIRYVPPGWDEWAVPISRGDSYSGYSCSPSPTLPPTLSARPDSQASPSFSSPWRFRGSAAPSWGPLHPPSSVTSWEDERAASLSRRSR